MRTILEKIKLFFQNLLRKDVQKYVQILGVYSWNKETCLIGAHKKTGALIIIPRNKTGFIYKNRRQGILVDRKGEPIHIEKDVERMVFSTIGSHLFMLFTKKSDYRKKIHIAISKDGRHFKKKTSVFGENPIGIAELYEAKPRLVLFYGEDTIHTYASVNNGQTWKQYKKSVFIPQGKKDQQVEPVAIGEHRNHLYLLYKLNNHILDALIDNPNISHTIWESTNPSWKHEEHYDLLGVIFDKSYMTVYIRNTLTGSMEEALIQYPDKRSPIKEKMVEKHSRNPILSPREYYDWESQGTFNPATLTDDQGYVHLLYRAIGKDGVSRLGYASSKDGYTFDDRSISPAYVHGVTKHNGPKMYAPQIYPSGGSWGGCEDPRLTCIDDKVYMTYTAFSGWGSIRIAMTSISVDDFKKKNWHKWNKPTLLSPPDETHKNWVIFPEKINGKYAILHGIAPRILIEYVDDLDNIPDYIKSERPQGPQVGRDTSWDNLLRGAGPPPIKTPLGWLLLYHALDRREFHKYKVGAMILDADDPTKILYRSHEPVIEPELYYENEGKPGIVYASGAFVKNGQLFIYYGGGDKVSCVATASLDKFLHTLQEGYSFSGVLRTTKVT